jgi:enamine deaminase RidA (YjgF/YER057c/UK114 family)
MDLSFLNSSDAPRRHRPRPTATPFARGDWLFVTGQLGVDPATGKLVAGGTVAQCRQVMQNHATVLGGAGPSLDRAVMARIYLTNFAAYEAGPVRVFQLYQDVSLTGVVA